MGGSETQSRNFTSLVRLGPVKKLHPEQYALSISEDQQPGMVEARQECSKQRKGNEAGGKLKKVKKPTRNISCNHVNQRVSMRQPRQNKSMLMKMNTMVGKLKGSKGSTSS